MWLALKDLYTDIKARVLFADSFWREFNISQGTGQGRLLAQFMYKVYINGLLKTLSEHWFAISINSFESSLTAVRWWRNASCIVLVFSTISDESMSQLQFTVEISVQSHQKWCCNFWRVQTHTLKINERAQMASGSYGCVWAMWVQKSRSSEKLLKLFFYQCRR